MTEKQRIKEMLVILEEPIEEATQGTRYDVPWIMALTNRECGWKFQREVEKGKDPREVLENMKGDYGKRPGETKEQYHGFSPFQIDKDTAPQFGRLMINRGEWTDLFKAAKVCIAVLEEKRDYLDAQGMAEEKLGTNLYNRAITAAYNCGQGRVVKALRAGVDVDRFTYSGDYSKDVFRVIPIVHEIIREQHGEMHADAIEGEDIEVSPEPKPAETSNENEA